MDIEFGLPQEALHESILVVPRRCAKLKALTLSNLGVSKASSDAARGHWPLILVHHALCTRTCPMHCSSLCLAIHRFDSANSVTICAVFFLSPR